MEHLWSRVSVFSSIRMKLRVLKQVGKHLPDIWIFRHLKNWCQLTFKMLFWTVWQQVSDTTYKATELQNHRNVEIRRSNERPIKCFGVCCTISRASHRMSSETTTKQAQERPQTVRSGETQPAQNAYNTAALIMAASLLTDKFSAFRHPS